METVEEATCHYCHSNQLETVEGLRCLDCGLTQGPVSRTLEGEDHPTHRTPPHNLGNTAQARLEHKLYKQSLVLNHIKTLVEVAYRCGHGFAPWTVAEIQEKLEDL